MSTPVEFQPWDAIPASHKRGEGDDREVLGATFLGEPAWLPYMGEPVPGVDYDPAVCDNCGKDEHTPAELAECIDSMLGPRLADLDADEAWYALHDGWVE